MLDSLYLIAEIGINHNGDIQNAKRLIDATFAANWNCVKLQKRTPELCVPEHQKNVSKETPWGVMSYLDYKKKIEFDLNDYKKIDDYCNMKPISWSASIWDMPSLEFITKNFPNVPFIKIPSAMLTNYELIECAAKTNTKIILSTGMSTLDQIDKAIFVLRKHTDNFAILHTNSSYPTPPEDINLSLIPFLQKRYGCEVGYSGHEQGLEPTVVAAVLGARIIERHITISHEEWGTDQKASLEFHAMKMLRNRIEEAIISLGDGIKKITNKESEILKKLKP